MPQQLLAPTEHQQTDTTTRPLHAVPALAAEAAVPAAETFAPTPVGEVVLALVMLVAFVCAVTGVIAVVSYLISQVA